MQTLMCVCLYLSAPQCSVISSYLSFFPTFRCLLKSLRLVFCRQYFFLETTHIYFKAHTHTPKILTFVSIFVLNSKFVTTKSSRFWLICICWASFSCVFALLEFANLFSYEIVFNASIGVSTHSHCEWLWA